MNLQKQAKVNEVAEVTEKLANSKALVIAEYAGLSVKELQELRNLLHAKGVELKVYKNRLFKIAAKKAGHDLDSHLVGPNIYAFGMEDEISPAKILSAFSKDHHALKLKGGIYEGHVIDHDQLMEVASLPSWEEALTMLATSLLAPVSQVAKGLHLLIEENKLSTQDDSKESETAVENKAEDAKATDVSSETPKTQETQVEKDVKTSSTSKDKE